MTKKFRRSFCCGRVQEPYTCLGMGPLGRVGTPPRASLRGKAT
jgi:hypothetical protein